MAPATRRRVRRALVGVPLLMLLAAAAASAWLWATTPLPAAGAVQPPQATVLRWSDGSELARLGAHDRRPVPLTAVSPHVRHAVLAAEDRGFDGSPGVSLRGTLRAAWVNLRRGEVEQGGSTIAQQYARAAFLTPERTWTRKAREAVLALKLLRERGHEQVLEDYLNTVYFGRGAHGVEAAAQAFFGRSAGELGPAEAAVLAAQLRSPLAYDPARDPAAARARWEYVLDGMAERGWLDARPAAYPDVLPRRTPGDRLGGPTGHLVQHALAELAARGLDRDDVETGGLDVVTTFDRGMQEAAVRAVEAALPVPLPDGVYAGLVSVEPGTGRVRAEYGGDDHVRRPFNAVTQGSAQAGSSFKAYVLAAALSRGIPLSATLDGSSPRLFGDYRVRNAGGAGAGEVDVVAATARSVNTAYVELAVRTGPRHVAAVAEDLGITADTSVERDSPAIALGVTTVTPLEQAVAYATLAAGGVRAEPFVLETVTGPRGRVLHRAEPRTERVLDEDVAADALSALQAVVRSGTGRAARVPGRPSAGKTGTTSGNTAAWYVGVVPQLSTAVAVYSERADRPLRGFAGVREVTGGSLPARIWGRYTAAALAGAPVEPLPEPAGVGPPPVPPAPTPSPLPPRQDDGPRELPPPEPGAPLELAGR